MGALKKVAGHAQLLASGVDISNQFNLIYEHGLVASCSSSVSTQKPEIARIVGELGEIRIDPRFFCPTKASLWRNDELVLETEQSIQGKGYSYEIAEVERCLVRGQTHSLLMPPKQTLLNLNLMDTLRQSWQSEIISEDSLLQS